MEALLHFAFDIAACLAALAAGLWQRKKFKLPDNPFIDGTYIFVLLLGTVLGGYFFGTFNLILLHQPVLAHSILGALAGGVLFVEIYKVVRKNNSSTGWVYALPFCVAVTVGRIGCFLGGLDDMTYGTPSNLPWAVDFGDGVTRHPVQLYESFTMALVAIICVMWLKRQMHSYIRYAFPSVVGLYCLQRFLWEFLKPYSALAGGLNLFQILCVALMVYSVALAFRRRRFV